MKLRDFLVESSEVTIYHGDNFNTIKIEPKLMNNGNNQTGIGISFGSLEVAETYGKNLVKATVNPNDFFEATDSIGDKISIKEMTNIFSILHKTDNEPLYYMLTDWEDPGVEPEDIDEDHLESLAGYMVDEQVRNFQITLSEAFGVIDFVEAWNKVLPKNLGTYDSDTKFYCIINPKVKLTKVD